MKTIYFDSALYPEEAAALDALKPMPGTRIFGIDFARPAEGIAAMIAARRAGITCAIFPIFADPYEATLGTIFRSIAAAADPEVRWQQLDALSCDGLMVNEKKPREFSAVPDDQLKAAALALRLADVVLLAAPGERDRWSELFTRTFYRCELLPAVAAGASSHLAGDGVTIFAPSLLPEDTAPYAALLASRRIPSRAINATNPTEAIATRVVLVPEWRPMRARALAAAGYHVATANVRSVEACDSRIFGYDPANYQYLFDAVDAAMSAAGGGPRFRVSHDDLAAAIAREGAAALDGPRISMIVRTYNRPALLARAIASIAAQTHRDVEIVVVNNGGDDVAAIVESAAKGRPVRYESMSERKHISAASNVGARASTGAYVGYLDDDDLIYGDHCARTVDALERSRADLAFTMCLGEYAVMTGDDKRVLGYQVYLDRAFHSDNAYIANFTPIHSIVHPRSLFERFGYFDESLPVTDDWELWLRVISGGGRVLRIDRVTCEYSWRYDPMRGNMTIEHQWDFVHAYGKIAERYAADVAARPSILGQQRHMYESQQQRALDAADPAKAANVVISTMTGTMVAVAPVPALTEDP